MIDWVCHKARLVIDCEVVVVVEMNIGIGTINSEIQVAKPLSFIILRPGTTGPDHDS